MDRLAALEDTGRPKNWLLTSYYLNGIPNSAIKADPERAREMFSYAASYFGNADAQYDLARLYLHAGSSRDDFRYSNAMMRAGFNWDAGNLRQYLADPQAKVKGNRMPFSGLADPKDVDDVIAYIGTLK